MINMHNLRLGFVAVLVALVAVVAPASEGEHPVTRDYRLVTAPAAPRNQSQAAADAKSAGCLTCHTASDEWTMHAPKSVTLGCTDCHGGNTRVLAPAGLAKADPAYIKLRDDAHVLPRFPETWHFPSSANPKRSYTLLNKEAPEFVRFVNPSDYRVARESCGACHLPTDRQEKALT